MFEPLKERKENQQHQQTISQILKSLYYAFQSLICPVVLNMSAQRGRVSSHKTKKAPQLKSNRPSSDRSCHFFLSAVQSRDWNSPIQTDVSSHSYQDPVMLWFHSACPRVEMGECRLRCQIKINYFHSLSGNQFEWLKFMSNINNTFHYKQLF